MAATPVETTGLSAVIVTRSGASGGGALDGGAVAVAGGAAGGIAAAAGGSGVAGGGSAVALGRVSAGVPGANSGTERSGASGRLKIPEGAITDAWGAISG